MLTYRFHSPVDGQWSDWSVPSTCSVTCGTGTRTKTRTCDNPAPAHGGAQCIGSSDETEACQEVDCPGLCRLIIINIFSLLNHDVLLISLYLIT